MEFCPGTDVSEPAVAFFDRLEAELIAIEAACPVEVLSGELGDGVR